MHGEKSRFLLRHLFTGKILQNLRYVQTPLVNIRVVGLNLIQNRIPDLHSAKKPHQGRLEMGQEALYELVVLLEKICVLSAESVDHPVYRLPDLLAVYGPSRRGVPLHLFMFGSSDVKADIRKFHFGYCNLKLFFQFRYDGFCQTTGPVHFFLLRQFLFLDHLVFHNAVHRYGNMDHKPHIGIFCKRLYLGIVHPHNAVDHTPDDILVQNTAYAFPSQNIIASRGASLIGFFHCPGIDIFTDKSPDGAAVVFFCPLHADSASRLAAHTKAVSFQPLLRLGQIRADGSFADSELAAVIEQFFKAFLFQDLQYQAPAPLLPVSGVVISTFCKRRGKFRPGPVVSCQPHAHSGARMKRYSVFFQASVHIPQFPLNRPFAYPDLFREIFYGNFFILFKQHLQDLFHPWRKFIHSSSVLLCFGIIAFQSVSPLTSETSLSYSAGSTKLSTR